MEEQQAKITVIIGPNGCGKTQWVEQLRRRLASDRVRYVAFSDAYGPATDKAYYLQLRWNQHDIDQDTPLVGQLLDRAYQLAGGDSPERQRLRDHLYQLFDIGPLLDKYVILLSSGELRKFQLIKTLLSNPLTLILDNPFIGLDAETRASLRQLLLQLAREQRLSLYLVLAKDDELPDYADEVVRLGHYAPTPSWGLNDGQRQQLLSLPSPSVGNSSQAAPIVIDMHQVAIRYGERTILSNLDWQVRQGERWALSGQNGSGKSTLLSLVCADNPQSYACDIALFGHRRGSGESIWEIKRRIGYVSPEMHRSYQRDLPAINVVASGLKDTVGLYVRPSQTDLEQSRWWMRLFCVEQLASRSFLHLSSVEQRLVLVARAFVKDPVLLILDAPLHGLDDQNRHLVRNIIETFCQRPGKTLIMVTHYEEELPPCINKRLYLKRQ